MKITPARTRGFLAAPDKAVRAILVYGRDTGLVDERVDALAKSVVPDLGDPFRVARMTGAALAADPARLADEAAAFAFGGGRRVVIVDEAEDNAAAAARSFLDAPLGDAMVVLRGGDLGARSNLRKLFEERSEERRVGKE